MQLSFVVFLLVLFTVFGCSSPANTQSKTDTQSIETELPLIKPPKYSKGDVITVKPKSIKCQLGIIIEIKQHTNDNFRSTHWWEYTVMFQNINIELKENEIELYKHAVWIAPDGEITLEGFP